jgi:hypothetical protein
MLVVVAVLTANGAALHARVLPVFDRNLGRGLFDGIGLPGRALMLGCGAVSCVSWAVAFLLGAVRELNFAAPLTVFLGAYAAARAAGAAAAWVVAPRPAARGATPVAI